MTADEVKERLRAYRRIRNECEGLKNRIERKRSDMNYLQAIVTDGAPRSGEISHSVERTVERMDALVREYASMVNKCEEEEKQILNMINSVSQSRGRAILIKHYINGIPLDWRIYDMLGIARNTMWKYYNSAIEEIGQNWD